MLKLADGGANVLHPRSIIMAKNYDIPLEVRDINNPEVVGTLICRSNRQR